MKWIRITTCCLGILAMGMFEAPAQEMPVPIELQLSLFVRIFKFDRNYDARTQDNLVMGVLYQRTFRASFNVKDDLQQLIEGPPSMTLDHKSFKLLLIDVSNNENVDSLLIGTSIDFLYVTPLRGVDIKTITAVSRARGILTATGVPHYVEEGIAVGIGSRGERPEILINLPAARSEGSDFPAQLLRLARVYR